MTQYVNIKKYQDHIDKLIQRDISDNPYFADNTIMNLTKDSLTGGKRLRAIIILSIINRLNEIRLKDNPDAIRINGNKVALAVEYIHNVSLMIDDMPAMDNDIERRGLPTIHHKWGSTNALLGSYNLTIGAFKHLLEAVNSYRTHNLFENNLEQYHKMSEIIYQEVTNNLSMLGLCGGQYLDLNIKNILIGNDVDIKGKRELIMELIEKKTSSLFTTSFLLGWLIGGGDIEMLSNIKKIGSSFGLIYQMADDVHDLLNDLEKGNANNICEYYNKEELNQLFFINIETIITLLSDLNIYTSALKEIIQYISHEFYTGIDKIIKVNTT